MRSIKWDWVFLCVLILCITHCSVQEGHDKVARLQLEKQCQAAEK